VALSFGHLVPSLQTGMSCKLAGMCENDLTRMWKQGSTGSSKLGLKRGAGTSLLYSARYLGYSKPPYALESTSVALSFGHLVPSFQTKLCEYHGSCV
jgi:hypothetical protein